MSRLLRSPANLLPAALVLFCFICPINVHAALSIPSSVGPLEVTADSYPFGAAFTTTMPQDLSKFGYVEEEFLVSGKANVYELTPQEG